MFADKSINDLETGDNLNFDQPTKFKKFKPFIIIGAALLLIVIVFIIIFSTREKAEPIIEPPPAEVEIIIGGLPEYPSLGPVVSDDQVKVDPVFDEAVEYLTFSEFYQAPEEVVNLSFLEYDLPLEIKSEVINYYNLNRQINLDPYLDELRANGFAVIDNPWPNQIKDFYSAYHKLHENQIPLFVSSDFILYHYNLILKRVFQEIESSFFYNSLWEINLSLYNQARRRYENYLAELGNINDPVLEAKRLTVAYFAVALELLKPQEGQVERDGRIDDNKFTVSDSQLLKFVLPDYLVKDVLPELELIREAKKRTKSPVMLYDRDYSDFFILHSYRQSARQRNFYLASIWLNSLFPLNYQSADCPDCLLDKNDWRINFIASVLISEDISNNQFLKAEWARLYKIMSFFEGLEDSLTYVYYRDDFADLFAEAPVAEVFSRSNEKSDENLEKLRASLLNHQFREIQGGVDYSLAANQALIGWRLLAQAYWPLDFVFEKLTYPTVGEYLNDRPGENNITACRLANNWQRCLGFSGDSLSLLGKPLTHPYFQENINYENYFGSLSQIQAQINNALASRHNAYWSQLAALSRHLSTAETAWPVFARNQAWQDRLMFSSVAALTDWQLPADQFSRLKSEDNDSVVSLVPDPADSPPIYIEPSINLINDLLANIQMLSKMLSALGADIKSNLAMAKLDSLYGDLAKLSDLAISSGEKQNLSQADQELILTWLQSYQIDQLGNKKISHDTDGRFSLNQDLSGLKFLIIVFPTDKGPTMALSPIFNLKESN